MITYYKVLKVISILILAMYSLIFSLLPCYIFGALKIVCPSTFLMFLGLILFFVAAVRIKSGFPNIPIFLFVAILAVISAPTEFKATAGLGMVVDIIIGLAIINGLIGAGARSVCNMFNRYIEREIESREKTISDHIKEIAEDARMRY